MPVVVVEEAGEALRALVGMGVGVSIGPLAEGGLDEAFGLAIGLRSVGPGEALLEAQACDFRGHGPRAVGGAVVGVETLGGDAKLGKEGQCVVEESEGTGGRFVWVELSKGEAGVIVDGDVEILPACAWGMVVLTIPGDAMTGTLDAGELLDIEVDEFTWEGAFVTAHRQRRFQGAEAVKTVAAQEAGDSGLGKLGGASDLEAWQLATAQSDHASHPQAVGGSGGTLGARGTIVETWEAFRVKAREPFVSGAFRDPKTGGDLRDGASEL
jgi:hypothetical protein